MPLWVGELCVSAIMIITAVLFFLGTSGFNASINPVDLGSAAFPQLISCLILLFAAGQVVFSVKSRNEKKEKVHFGQKRVLLGGLGLVILYLFFMPVIGYFYTTPAFIFLLLLLQGNRKWIQMAAISIGFALFAYIVFFRVLRVMLP